jgi:hypothetical protein
VAWCEEHAPAGPLTVIPLVDVDIDPLLDAWTSMYVWTHDGIGMLAAPDEDVRRMLETHQLPGASTESSQVAIRDGRIVGIAVVNPEAWDGRTFLLTETTRADEPAGHAVVAALVSRALPALAEAGFALVEFEGHDNDPHIEVLTSVPYVGADRLTGLATRE